MINGIIQQGRHMYVHGGHSTGGPYINMNNYSAGMTRYNGSTNNLEVYDGTSWMTISGSAATIGLNSAAESAIDWAMKKMAEESEMMMLADKHPAIKIAYENMQRAQEQLKATIILSKDEQTTT